MPCRWRDRLRAGKAAVLALVALAALAPAAFADIDSASVSPTTATVDVDGGSVFLTWTVRRTAPIGAGSAATTSSSTVSVLLNGQTLLTKGSVLSSTTNIPAGTSQTLTFRETLAIPVAVARTIAGGSGTATIRRNFTDSSQPGRLVSVEANLAIRSGSAGGVSVRRMELSFSDGNRTRVVPRAADLTAVADIRFQGGGLIEGEWRVSVNGGGSTFERRLGLVRRPVASAGSGSTRLTSPPLPTGTPGLYRVRLVLSSAVAGLTEPSISYYVTPDAALAVPEIAVATPAAGSLLDAETVFAWRAVPNAATYQIEIFKTGRRDGPADPAAQLLVGGRDDGAPVTGRVVPGTQTRSALAEPSLRHLAPGRSYQWRVRALGPAGEVLGASPLRPIRK